MDDAISALLDRFDFERLAAAMRAAGWRWARQQGPATIYFCPKPEDLRATAEAVAVRAWRRPGFPAVEGGFQASRFGTTLILSFVWDLVYGQVPAGKTT